MTKVSPVIEGGAYPAKAAVGEASPIRATVFREGHDAVNASVVLTDPDGQRDDRCRCSPTHPARLRLVARVASPAQPRGVDVPGRGLERPVGDLGAQRRDQDPGRHRRRTWSAPRARPCSTAPADAAQRPATTPTAALLRGAADEPGPAASRWRTGCAGRARRRGPRGDGARYGPRELVSPTPDYPVFVDRQAALFASWYEFFPRSEGARLRRGERDAGSPAPSTPPTSGSRRRRRWASTSSTCRRSTRSARTFRKGANNTLTPGPGDPGSPWAIGNVEGGHDAIHPDLGDFDAFDRFVAKAQVARPGDRAGLRAAGLPGPPVGHRAPGMVLPARRRLDRVRGEPAEEVPGHLPDQLRQRPGRHLRRVPADPASCG